LGQRAEEVIDNSDPPIFDSRMLFAGNVFMANETDKVERTTFDLGFPAQRSAGSDEEQ
jgi:hypothetical protein